MEEEQTTWGKFASPVAASVVEDCEVSPPCLTVRGLGPEGSKADLFLAVILLSEREICCWRNLLEDEPVPARGELCVFLDTRLACPSFICDEVVMLGWIS